MTAPLNMHYPQPGFKITESLSEDNTFSKLAAALPYVGFFVTLKCRSSLDEKITSELNQMPLNTNRVIQLIKLKNDYKFSAIISNLLMAAISISLYAAGILTGGLAPVVASTLIVLGISAFIGNQILANKTTIEKLENGIRIGAYTVH